MPKSKSLRPVSLTDVRKATERLAKINGVSYEEMVKRLDSISKYAIDTVLNEPLTTLSKEQWANLRDRGYCIVECSQDSILLKYLNEGRDFFALGNGLPGEFLVKVVAVQVYRNRALYILRDEIRMTREKLPRKEND